MELNIQVKKASKWFKLVKMFPNFQSVDIMLFHGPFLK